MTALAKTSARATAGAKQTRKGAQEEGGAGVGVAKRNPDISQTHGPSSPELTKLCGRITVGTPHRHPEETHKGPGRQPDGQLWGVDQFQ